MSRHKGLPRWQLPIHLAAALRGEYGERIQHHITARYVAVWLMRADRETDLS